MFNLLKKNIMKKKEFVEIEHKLFNDEIMSTESEMRKLCRFIYNVYKVSDLMHERDDTEKFTLELELKDLSLKFVMLDRGHFCGDGRDIVNYIVYIGFESDSGEYDYVKAGWDSFFTQNKTPIDPSFDLLFTLLNHIKLARLLKSGGHKMTVEQFHQLQVGIEKSDPQDFYENVPDDCIITCESDTLP